MTLVRRETRRPYDKPSLLMIARADLCGPDGGGCYCFWFHTYKLIHVSGCRWQTCGYRWNSLLC